ncbi:bis(5'-nucleosyl)-tetraphosphatase (symmetrical) YqeK [Bacillota bacterium]
MEIIKFAELWSEVEKRLSKSRMEHTCGVVREAEILAERYGINKEKAGFAALCHDMARCISREEMKKYTREFMIDDSYKDSLELSHGKIAAEWLKRDFAVNDSDILNAVSFHTTGRPGMSPLEKVVFLADATEPGRKYPGVDAIRETALHALDKGCLQSMERTIEYLNSKGYRIHEDTLKARDFLLAKEGREDE